MTGAQAPRGIKIAGFGSPDSSMMQGVQDCIGAEVQRLVAAKGLRAFEMPRSSAAAHETGHVIVSAHDGQIAKRVAVWSTDTVLGPAWGGMTYDGGGEVQFDHLTPVGVLAARLHHTQGQ